MLTSFQFASNFDNIQSDLRVDGGGATSGEESDRFHERVWPGDPGLDAAAQLKILKRHSYSLLRHMTAARLANFLRAEASALLRRRGSARTPTS